MITLPPFLKARLERLVNSKGEKCPSCGSKSFHIIAYGKPAGPIEDRRGPNNETYVSGGCMLGDNDPSFECKDCGKRY